jgi:uncharacterized repeat protein (TIGR01451 family)
MRDVRRLRFGWLAAALLGCAGFAPAQPEGDPDVRPAQFTRPVAPAPRAIADPPTPVVRIQVRVPASIAPGKDITYKLVVTNTSQANAYRVVIRNPIPEGASFGSAEPKPDKQDAKELTWRISTLRAGEHREIELVLKPTTAVKEIRNQAFVTFEHGEAVVTRVEHPKLSVRKSAPKQAVQTDPIPVRVEVANTGRVPIAGVELVEDVSKGFEFAADGDSEKTKTPQQRIWKLGTLQPGERKTIEYRLTAKDATELLTTSVVKCQEVPSGERAESTTKVLVPALTLDLTGPQNVPGGEAALYEITARNTGTLPLRNVRISGSLPADCLLTKMTENGRRYQDQVNWVIPQLKPSDAYKVRYWLKANTTGQRTVRAAARDSRGLEQAREVVTTFQGTSVLHWTARMESPTLRVGQQGLLTVTVQNSGGDSARNVRLRVELPPEVSLSKATPKNQSATNQVLFDSVTIRPDGEVKFTVTFKAEQAHQAWFRLKLQADTFGDQPPLTKEQPIVITGR